MVTDAELYGMTFEELISLNKKIRIITKQKQELQSEQAKEFLVIGEKYRYSGSDKALKDKVLILEKKNQKNGVCLIEGTTIRYNIAMGRLEPLDK